MKHITYGSKSLLVGDDAADLLLEYAATLTAGNPGDTVRLNAVSPDGNTVEVTVLLNGNTDLIAESTHSQVVPPSNEEAVTYLRQRLSAHHHPPHAQAAPPLHDHEVDLH